MKRLHIPAVPVGAWQIDLMLQDHDPVQIRFPTSQEAFRAYQQLRLDRTYLGHPVTGASLAPEPFTTKEPV
jgi:hypothetical protein